MADAKPQLTKILMVPWLAHGHITPFFELAKRLSKKPNFQIYISSSPVNLQSLDPNIAKSHSIELIDLHLPDLPDLPAHMHTTKGLPIHLEGTLMKAFDMSAPNFDDILVRLEPDLVVSDVFSPWAARLASARHVPAVNFMVSGIANLTRLAHAIYHSGEEFPFPELDFSKHWISKTEGKGPDDVGRECARRIFQCFNISSDVALINTFPEFEGKYIDYVSSSFKKKIIPIAPLVSHISTNDEQSEILDWLNKKNPKSTIYVSFGSEYYLKKQDREELAHGLEQSGANFIWVIRFPKGENIPIKEALPEGFLERVEGKGLIVEGWAPQLKILNHPNIGAFACHCGWNSMVESMMFGVPMVALPMHVDQPCNAKLAECAGVCIEAKRNDEGNFMREEVAKAIKKVLFEKAGEVLRENAKEKGEVLRKREEMNISDVVNEFRRLCNTRN